MREYGPGRPLVFSHIPKTAGTSLRAALREALQPTVFVQGFDTSLFGGYDAYDEIRPVARASVYLSPDQLPADATLVAGHISPWTTMQRFAEADHITILRAPQVRLISQFLHSRSVTELQLRHWGSAAEAFRAGWVPFRAYLHDPMVAPNTDNTITRFLAWPHPLLSKTSFIDEAHDEELLAAALDRLDRFAHVNLAENPAFMSDLATWLGRDLPDVRLNERTSVPPRLRPDLVGELSGAQDILDHRVRLDVQIWDHVARAVLAAPDPRSVLESAVATAVARYVDVLRQPHTTPPARRLLEGAYGLGVRFLPRRARRPRSAAVTRPGNPEA